MLYTGDDLLELLVKAARKEEKKEDPKKKKSNKCSCCECKKKAASKKKKPNDKKAVPLHERLALIIFLSPFILGLPFLFQTFNLLFWQFSTWSQHYTTWTLEVAKTIH